MARDDVEIVVRCRCCLLGAAPTVMCFFRVERTCSWPCPHQVCIHMTRAVVHTIVGIVCKARNNSLLFISLFHFTAFQHKQCNCALAAIEEASTHTYVRISTSNRGNGHTVLCCVQASPSHLRQCWHGQEWAFGKTAENCSPE